MSDQQQIPQAQQQPYPGFNVTSAGLTLLHQEAGRLLHQVIEQDARAAALSEQGQKLAQHNRLLLASHGTGKCAPVAVEDDERAPDDDEAEHELTMLAVRREEAG